MDCSLLLSFVHGISQARIPEWVAFPSLGHLPDPGIESVSLALEGHQGSHWAPRKVHSLIEMFKKSSNLITKWRWMENLKTSICLSLLQIYSLLSGLGPSEPCILCLQQRIPVKSRNLMRFPWEGTLSHSDDSGSQPRHSFFPRDSWDTGFIAKMPSSKTDYKKNSLSRWLVL